MGLRFRKSIKLAPGIRMNFSRSGLSWTLGPRGASMGIGKRGTFLNAGIPGTGLYTRERIGGSSPSRKRGSSASDTSISISDTSTSIKVGVSDDGMLYFQDADGNPLPERLVNDAKKQQGDVIRDLIEKKCDEINAQTEALGEIHLYTPDPNPKPQYQMQNYQEPPPKKPILKRPGLLAKLFQRKRARLERENAEKESHYERALKNWQTEKQRFEQAERRREEFIERDIYSDVSAMEIFLEENLQSIVWPRETNISAEILDGGKRIFLDVDLPEIEDMPNKMAAVPQRGYKLSVKEISTSQVRRLYMQHIHGVGFRIIGETFAALPNAQEVALSAFSQRSNAATGQVADDYLYSVRVDRNAWCRIRFDNLQNLDVVEALAQFDLRRSLTKTGAFKAIEPFGPNL
jgi:hypothetical protein